MITSNRRQLITGLISLMAAPAIVRASSLMPVKAFVLPDHREMRTFELTNYIGNTIYVDRYSSFNLGDIITITGETDKFIITAIYEKEQT